MGISVCLGGVVCGAGASITVNTTVTAEVPHEARV